MSREPIQGLVVFDLDGTLLRGLTVCEVVAESLGYSSRMRELESVIAKGDIVNARLEMVHWYEDKSIEDLLCLLPKATLAPGACEGIAYLQESRIEVAIASLTWEWAVEWFAQQFNIQYYLGTQLKPTGEISHVFPQDKAQWLRQLAVKLNIPTQNIVAVGDSQGDVDLLLEATHAFFVGSTVPANLEHVTHLPNANIMLLADRILHKLGVQTLRSSRY